LIKEHQIEEKILKQNVVIKEILENSNCKVYRKNMNYGSSYIITEFNNAYFKDNDIIGAKAQLFLIKNKSESVFSKNINKANSFYISQYNKAKNEKCNLEQFHVTPLEKVQNKVK